MIAFAASPEKLELLTREQQQSAYEIINTVTDINKLVSMLKNAQHYTQIIIDVPLFKNDEREVIKALYLLKSINNTKIILFVQGKGSGDTILSELLKIGLYDFVLSWDNGRALQEMQECVNGRAFEDVSQYAIEDTSEKGIFNKKVRKKAEPVIIQVIGVCPRIGTTTQAMRIVKSLVKSGLTACYTEINQSGHLQMISSVFSQVESIDHNTVYYKNLHMLHQKPQNEKYDYVVCDYGCYLDLTISDLDSNVKTIIIAGSTAWEMIQLPKLMELVNSFDYVSYMFSFTDKKDEQDILDFVGAAWCNTYFAEYTPDMFSDVTEIEQAVYKKLILGENKAGFSLLKRKRGQI